MSPRRLPLVAAALVVAAAGLTGATTPAHAAACGSASGVTVVVDFTKLGGGIATTCVTDGGGDSAGTLFEVDHDLTRVQRYPGAVCRVDQTPSDAPCQAMPPADAYWGLFWSDGSGGWVYSSEGVDALDVPDGGSVGFAWQDGGDRDQPGVAPPQHASAEPSSGSSSSGSGRGNGGGGGTGSAGDGQASTPAPTPRATASPSPTASAAATRKDRDDARKERRKKARRAAATESASASGEASPSDDPSAAVPAATGEVAAADGGLPVWAAPAAIGALFAMAGAVALRRRSALRR